MNFRTPAFVMAIFLSGLSECLATVSIQASSKIYYSNENRVVADILTYSSFIDNSAIDFKSGNDSILKKELFLKNKNSALLNLNDTIVFDLSQTSANINIIDFPVYISSSDSIHSVDFAFRYNQQKTEFDSLYVVFTNLQYLYYYNTADSTFRFTSNSIDPITTNLNLMTLRFEMQYGLICPGDIYDVEVYLNGNACSHIFTDCVISNNDGIINSLSSVNAYPNPVNSVLFIEAPKYSAIRISDLNGKTRINNICTNPSGTMEIDLQNLPGGIYLLSVTSDSLIYNRKIIVY